MGPIKASLALLALAIVATLSWRTHRYHAILSASQGPTPEPTTPILADLRLDHVPLDRALADLSSRYRLPLVVDWNATWKPALPRDTPITLHLYDLSAADALRAVVQQARVQTRAPAFCYWDGSRFRVTNADALHATRLQMAVYDLVDLESVAPGTLEAADWAWDAGHQKGPRVIDRSYNLEQTIKSIVDVGSWEDNGRAFGSIRVFNRYMFVRQTPAAHEGIRRILATLRRTHASPLTSYPELLPAQRLDTPGPDGEAP